MTRRGLIAGAALLTAAGLWAVSAGFAENTVASSTPVMKECKMNALERSACAIEMILDDIRATYRLVPGGGIGHIRQNGTTSYSIELLRDENVDVFTYTFDFADDKVSILSKIEE